MRKAGSRALVTDAEAWGETWRLHQDRYFQAHGLALRVDATALHPGAHIGPVRMRAVDSLAVARAEALRTANEQAARDPDQVLAALTRHNATFTEREVERYLDKHLGNGPGKGPTPAVVQDIAAVKGAVLGHAEAVALHDRETNEAVGRFPTRTACAQERAALADGAAVAEGAGRDRRLFAAACRWRHGGTRCGARRDDGHDWGATIAWTACMLRPDIFRAVAAMSGPFRARSPVALLAALRAMGLETFYWQYFQPPGIAEAELEADVAASLRRILYSGSGNAPPGRTLELVLPKNGGFLDLTLDPETLPAWLPADDLATMAAGFRHSGFRGGLNYYRNLDRNWALMAPMQGMKILQPALFVAGTRDLAITGIIAQQSLAEMPRHVIDLRQTLLIEGAGHWIQQERPDEVNAALIKFLAGL